MATSATLKIQDQTFATRIKHLNLQNICRYFYEANIASKLEISKSTGLSLPTVAVNIEELIQKGLVRRFGEQKSTGGRKPLEFQFIKDAKIALGVVVLKEGIRAIATDLFGTILGEKSEDILFQNEETYYRHLGEFINSFQESLHLPEEKFLGVSIAIQGLISDDGELVTYSEILKCTNVTKEIFQKHISLPCSLIHDNQAAVLAEIWQAKNPKNVAYIALNRNFGGGIALAGKEKEKVISSTTLEHMCIDPKGPLCYCGKHGCIETFCSANRLQIMSEMEIPEFFQSLHKGDRKCLHIWKDFLEYLAIAMDNVRMVVDCDFIIGGYLTKFMNEEDFRMLKDTVHMQCFTSFRDSEISISKFGDRSAQMGAAISIINQFLHSL